MPRPCSAPTNPPPTLAIQHVTIWWTKASRGMPQAQVRAQLPSAYPLTPAEIAALVPGGIQLVTLREEESFIPHTEIRPLPNKAHILLGAVTVGPTTTGVHIRYHAAGMVGAPARSHRPPIEFDVTRGHRARIAYNGRFSSYSIEWLYKLTVVTLAVDIAPHAAIFTSAPDHQIEDLAELF